MPRFIDWIRNGSTKDTAPVNRYEGFTSNGAVVLRDRRGTSKAEIPDVDTKGITMGDDPLAIYKPTGANSVDASKAMGNFTGWTFAAVTAIASEVSNIQLRLYKINGERFRRPFDRAERRWNSPANRHRSKRHWSRLAERRRVLPQPTSQSFDLTNWQS